MSRTGPALDRGAAELLSWARRVASFSRTEVAEETGWARMTVQSRIDELLQVGLLSTAPTQIGSRGRPAARYRFNHERADLLIIDVGASGARLARCDLAGQVLERREVQLDIAAGPEAVLDLLTPVAAELVPPGQRADRLWGVGVSLPGPVEFATGKVVSPPIMTGWDGYDVRAGLQERMGGADVLVDNDATAKAWGEYQVRYPASGGLVFVKAGTGIGAGLVANGLPLRGANGAAGDIGHTWAAEPSAGREDRPLCRCGKLGCVEAYSGGWAIARDLQEQGLDCRGAEDVLRLVRAGEPLAIKLVRDAGRTLGSALAYTVSLVNPSAVVVGGTLSRTGEHLLGGIREQIAAHSLPLATRDLTIETSPLKGDSGVQGLAHMVADRVLA